MKMIYFSPTNTTKNILHKIVEEMAMKIDKEYNLTNYEYKDFSFIFNNENILLGFPVYSGRVPITALNRFSNIKGKNSRIIICATFGNRNYDNALMEIYELFKNNGFNIIGLIAVVTQHSFVKSIGKNRPNEEDSIYIKSFSKKMVEKIDGNIKESVKYEIIKPYREYQTIPIKPKGNRNCKKCGFCIKLCPENAINKTNPRKTQKTKCISCLRCVKYCPNGSRDLTSIEKYISKKFIESKCKENKKTEIII